MPSIDDGMLGVRQLHQIWRLRAGTCHGAYGSLRPGVAFLGV